MSGIVPGIVIKKAPNIAWIRQEMREIGVDPQGAEIMAPKFQHLVIRLYDIHPRQTAIIKQEMLACGADAAVSWRISSWQSKDEKPEGVLLSGTLRQITRLIAKLKMQTVGLAELADRIDKAVTRFLQTDVAPLKIGDKSYDWRERTYLMGIINLTPDSFSGDGLYKEAAYIEAAVNRAEQLIAAGADFLDLGAESTRPGAALVDEEEEARRLLPVLKELSGQVRVPLSVDTSKPVIAARALELGATIVNDVWGLQAPHDPEHRMAQVVADAKAAVIVMHNKSEAVYKFLIPEILSFLQESLEIALRAGVEPDRIIVDPGIGFGKTYQDNLQVLAGLEEFKVLGRPILLGVSRKSVIGLTLDLPAQERLEGSIAAAVCGVNRGANIIRVHDVKEHYRAIKVYDTINRS